ncbi:MAG TPA: 2-hydroxyacyl-CoA dehydratase [Victivallales bacterium]|nr:2-hydroxyacyl-CoA dehydratase [Victivallales bacterium]HPO90528.1 2-hydroxyacyl-CoA dehydratase [Victivallales bacterium]HRR05688.1 2-hydroxyacyl-CoA dehydratase [Victivallales bacterium]
MNSEFYLGIDIGSTTLKAVLLSDKGKVKHSLYTRTRPAEVRNDKLICEGRCHECGKCNLGSLKKTISEFIATAGIPENKIAGTVVTGSQIVEGLKKFIKYDEYVSEISAHVAGAQQYYPECRAILDVGGQDSKAILYNESMGLWMSKMSGICAAGTGAFLDSVAAKLNVPVEEMADKVNYDSDLEFSSVCAVLSATSINKFKNRFPIGDIIAGACRAQARTIMSGVGEIFLNYKGDILFQGGVAANRAVAYYLREITGNNIIIPEFHRVMGALGAAVLARQLCSLRNNIPFQKKEFKSFPDLTKLKSISHRANLTRKEFFSGNKNAPLVWRNLFFPSEILNAMGLRSLTLETYAALHARNQKKVRKAFDNAGYKGFSAETCSFLRIIEGVELPKPAFIVSTSEPCQQGERIFRDLAREYGIMKNFYSLHTPFIEDNASLENIAEGLEEAVFRLEKATGITMDPGKLAEACELSNEAREIAMKCNELRLKSPPLIRGSDAVYFATMFSQLWGKKELVELHKNLLSDLEEKREKLPKNLDIQDTHRLIWLHLPPFYDSKLLDFIEIQSSAPIIFEEVNFVDWEPLNPEDPFRSLAKKLLTVGFLDPHLRASHVVNTSIKGNLNGCILYNHMFGRCSMADSSFIKLLRENLVEAKIPLLVLDGDCIDPTIDPCSTYTKVSAYIEALNETKYGNIFGPEKIYHATSLESKNIKSNAI